MAVGGSSVHVSSGRVVAKAKKIAAGMLEVDEKDISYREGQFSVPGTDIAPLTFGTVARMAYVGHKLPDGLEPGLDETVFYDPKGMGSPSGIHMAYVDVDPETGIVDILDYVAVDDAGTIINPLLATAPTATSRAEFLTVYRSRRKFPRYVRQLSVWRIRIPARRVHQDGPGRSRCRHQVYPERQPQGDAKTKDRPKVASVW